MLVDRFGARRVVIAGELLPGVGFLGYLGVTPATGAVARFSAALVVALGQRLYWSAYFTLVADIAPPAERDRWYELGGAAQAAGMGAGGLLIGLLVASVGTTGYTVAVAVNGLSSLVAAGLMLVCLPEPLRTAPQANLQPLFRAGLGPAKPTEAGTNIIPSSPGEARCHLLLLNLVAHQLDLAMRTSALNDASPLL